MSAHGQGLPDPRDRSDLRQVAVLPPSNVEIDAGPAHHFGAGRALLNKMRKETCVIFLDVHASRRVGRGRSGTRCRLAQGHLTPWCMCGL